MTSKIIIEELILDLLIGIHPHERITTQKILINMEIEVDYDFNKRPINDDIEKTFDYEKLICEIKDSTKKIDFLLLESLGEMILNQISDLPLVKKVKLGIYKPQILGSKKLGIQLEK